MVEPSWRKSVKLSFLEMGMVGTDKHYVYLRNYGTYNNVHCQENEDLWTSYLNLIDRS